MVVVGSRCLVSNDAGSVVLPLGTHCSREEGGEKRKKTILHREGGRVVHSFAVSRREEREF